MQQKLPDLRTLSHAQKDALIVELFGMVKRLTAEVERLTKRVAELEGRLGKDSHNSSKPPSTEGFKKTKSQRTASGKKPGGQPGHPGSTLRQMTHPDRLIEAPIPERCDACGGDLADRPATLEARQVIDIAPLRLEVTEYRLRTIRCTCGKIHRSPLPAGVREPVQYGPRTKALVVYLNDYQLLPVRRTADLLQDLWGASMSPASVDAYMHEAGQRLHPMVEKIRAAATASSVLHLDESGLRVAGKLHWLHTAATPELSWYAHHPKRGLDAFESFGILPRFTGTAVHDGFAPYRDYACRHALCNAHHLRELIWISETTGQAWAQEMIDLLIAAKKETDAAGGKAMSASCLANYLQRFEQLVAAGQSLNPERAHPKGGHRRAKQSDATNLLKRFARYRLDILRFLSDPAVPFDNNLAERAIRMPKLKQKISGAFRSDHGADTFCAIRSYLATLRKQGMDLFRALTCTFQGKPPAPSFTRG
jgi:transposase